MEQYEYLNGPPAPRMVAELAMRHDALVRQLADAQATIAALQARVQELEQWVQDQSTANLETMRHTDEMQSRAMEAEQQLTQRTVELEALRPLYDDMWKQFAESQAELERVRGLVRALPAYKDISVSHRIDENDYESWHVWVDHNPLAECDTEEEANAIKALYEHRQGMEG